MNDYDRRRLIRQCRCSVQAKLLLYVLMDYLGKNETCWPTVETLANDCSLSHRRINQYLKELTAAGIVRTHRRRNSSAHRWINWDALDAPSTAHPDEQDTSQATSRKRRRRRSEDDAGDASGDDADDAQKGAVNEARNLSREPITSPYIPKRGKKGKKKKDSEEERRWLEQEQEFIRHWNTHRGVIKFENENLPHRMRRQFREIYSSNG